MYIKDIRPPLPTGDISWIIPGDLHVDTRATRVKALYELVHNLVARGQKLHGIIFQGDTLDREHSIAPKEFLEFLSWLHEHNVRLVMLPGNHDPNIKEIIVRSSHRHNVRLPPIEFPNAQFRFGVGTKKFLVLHGDVFDDYVQKRKRTTLLATWLYDMIQAVDGEEQRVSRKIKKFTKKLFRLGKVLGERAMSYAHVHGANVAVCGHVHIATHVQHPVHKGKQHYFNAGCFTAVESYLVSVSSKGRTRLHRVVIKKKK